jgi:hypothetical protein
MVAKHPADRYQTMGEVIAALQDGGRQASRGEMVELTAHPDVSDANLASFLRNVGAAATQKRSSPATAVDDTLSRQADAQTLSPRDSPLKSLSKRIVPRDSALLTTLRNSRFAQAVAALCVAGVMVVCWGVWVIVRDRHGPEAVRIEAPAKDSAERIAAPPSANAAANNESTKPSPSPAPEPVAVTDWVFDAWQPLFDGTSLTGWRAASMSIANGTLVNYGQRGLAVAPGEYKDFEFEMDFWLAEGGNSGLGIRYSGDGDPSQNGLEIQLLDDYAYPNLAPAQRCGSVYGLAAAWAGFYKRSEWNTLNVRCLGPVIEVALNGTTVTKTNRSALIDAKPDHVGALRESGSICLFPHTGRSEYRYLRIRRAKPAASNATRVPSGTPLDLLPLAHPQQDAIWLPRWTGKNAWQRVGTELLYSADGQGGFLRFPIAVRGSQYELEAEFTRTAGTSGVNLDLPSPVGVLSVQLQLPRDVAKLGIDNGSQRDFKLTTGKRTRALVRVTKADQDHISVQIDGQLLLDWRGNREAATKRTPLPAPYEATVNLGPLPGDGSFTFHLLRLTMLDGYVELLPRAVP